MIISKKGKGSSSNEKHEVLLCKLVGIFMFISFYVPCILLLFSKEATVFHEFVWWSCWLE